jgi:lipoteichoic acid synthase
MERILLPRWPECLRKSLNVRFLLLFGLSIVNLLFMHYQLALTVEFEYPFKLDALMSNVLACLLDVSFFFLLGMLILVGRVKQSLLFTFVCTMLLSFCNVLYSRFFAHYLPNLALTQVGNLNDGEVIQSIMAGFRAVDLCYVLLALLFGWLYCRFDRKALKVRYLRTLGLVWGVLLTVIAAFIVVLWLFRDPSFEVSYTRFSPIRVQFNQAPNNMLFRSGFVRRAIVCHEDFFRRNMVLDEAQVAEIEQAYTDYSERTTASTIGTAKPNLIFIIVESYLSLTSDLKVDGKEITPFLNRLKRDSTVYYNGQVQPNINIGESSDGQFIYMTGVLPLKSEITVNVMKGKTVPGLPKVLKAQHLISHSHAIVPTSPTFWEQDAMCEIYGIERLYSKFDAGAALQGNKDLTDEQIFQMASRVDCQTQSPFFSLILTMSMHNPYDKCVEHDFTLTDETLTPEYRNYLIDCHYFDMQIEKYINALKQHGVYDNSIIVITADHHAHPSLLQMDESSVSNQLPLYIINGGFSKSQVWTGPCNQLDVYTTLLDMYGIRKAWRGFGHTLLNPDYKNSVTEKVQTLSDWMIWSDYFGR